ncbi:MAG: energy transducer TonB [Bacteroidales bacterium]|nr:energy transducer TonB [Bacteroidales bacterium]
MEEGFNKACEEEAIRVVKLFPKWEPGKVGNKPVRVRMVLPINYSIQFQ